jgi:hypothetical protein
MSEVAIIPPAVVPLRAGARVQAIIPQTVEEVFRLATAIHKSGLAPSTMSKVEQITVAIMHGMELGLPPMTSVQKIAVVNGRPTIFGDAVPALLLSRGFRLVEKMDGVDDARGATCCVIRPDGTKIERRFSIGDAKIAGLWGKAGPWKQYPDRMLQMRARGFAARDGAADVLAGLYIAEEAQDIEIVRTRKSSAECKRDGTQQRFDEIRRQIAAATTVADIDRIESDNEAEIASMATRWAEIVNDELAARREDLRQPADAQAVLRAIERDLDSKTASAVESEYANAIMAMDEDSRAAALEMIEARKQAAE